MPDFTDPTHALGYRFERHVIGLFGKKFRVVRWARDGTWTKEDVDFYPDLEIEHLPTGTVFGVEAKFRSTLFEGNISWAKEYQMGKYERYADRSGHRLFIVIGIGGRPESPEYMYCLPLWQARKANILNPTLLKRYRRNPRRVFDYDAGSGELK